MRLKKQLFFGVIFLIGVFFLSLNVSAYEKSNVNYGLFDNYVSTTGYNYKDACEAGQDFLVQIAPLGCEPTVITSDLLEEQNVPVFCQLAATKINPLIDVKAIESISFTGDYPDLVSGVGFHPAQAALGTGGNINNAILENIGYVVVILKETPAERDMPDYVAGNLTARIKYDIENAFGIGQTTFYLSPVSEDEWEKNKNMYSFWEGNGLIRVLDIDEADGTAIIAVYDESADRLSREVLKKGETSDKIYFPEFDCITTLKVQLASLVSPGTKARLDIDGQTIEVLEGEKFLDNKCVLRDIDKEGLSQTVKIYCNQDDEDFAKSNTFRLAYIPRVQFSIDSELSNYVIGDKLNIKDENIYLAYVGTKDDSSNMEDLHVLLYNSPTNLGNSLSEENLNILKDLFEGKINHKLKSNKNNPYVSGKVEGINSDKIKGDFYYISSGNEIDLEAKDSKINVKLLGLGNIQNVPSVAESTSEYSVEFVSSDSSGIYYDVEGVSNLRFYLDSDSEEIVFFEPDNDFNVYFNLDDSGFYVFNEDSSIDLDKLPQHLKVFFKNIKKISLGDSEKIDYDFVKSEDSSYFLEEVGLNIDVSSTSISFDNLISIQGGSSVINFNLDETSGLYVFDESGSSNFNQLPQDQKEFFENVDRISFWCDGSTCYLSLFKESVLKTYSEFDIGDFLNGGNIDSDSSFFDDYKAAMDDYDSILAQFSGAKESGSEQTFGEKALVEKIKLAFETQNLNDLAEFCDLYNKEYEDSLSTINEKYCSDEFFANSEISSNRVYIDGVSHLISFQKLYEPLATEYGAKIKIRDVINNIQETITLGVNDKYYLGNSDREYIQLRDVSKVTDIKSDKEDSVKLNVNLNSFSKEGSFIKGTKTLEREEVLTFGSSYSFELEEVYFEQQAKVVVKPSIENTYTEANFSFNLSIEKRAIQLTPDQIRDKIASLDESIKEWSEKQETLAGLVKVLKGTCLVVEGYLTVKNFFSNVDGSAIARKDVMRGVDGEGGWYEICANQVNDGRYSSVDECLLDNSNVIDKEVDDITTILESKNQEFQTLQQGCVQERFLKSDIVDSDCLKEKYITDERVDGIVSDLKTQNINTIKVGSKDVNVGDFKEVLKQKTSVIEMRDIEVYLASAAASEATKDMFQNGAKDELSRLYSQYVEDAQRAALEKQAASSGYKNFRVDSYGVEGTIQASYYGETIKGGEILFEASFWDGYNKEKVYPFSVFNYRNTQVISFLERAGTTYNVLESYKFKSFGEAGEIYTSVLTQGIREDIKKNFQFALVDASAYKNKYKNPKVKYYTNPPNEGTPAIVPFDIDNGWYAAISVSSTTPAVDASGAVNSFWLCNVGKNGKEDNRGNDDIFQRIDVYKETTYTQFAGLSEAEVQKLVRRAISAIEKAQKAYQQGNEEVVIDGKSYEVIPYAAVPTIQCQDFMSPSDCNLLFNVCDPVICPSSRCDYGGAYKVKDVIQSGIIGSVLLCLPNFKEGIYVPICLSGINAGLQSYISILQNHKDCLQTSLDTGESVGICDEIYSIYLCEFFWEQALPLTKIAIPTLIGSLLGQGARGGGEYLGAQSAFDAAGDSVDYFTDYYAANSFQAFKARVTDDVGGSICKAYVSGVYPTDDIFDDLTEPDSPPQFYGEFSSEIYTTATIPSVSQYKVFYHIFAGTDSRGSYKVYLKAKGGTSLYEDSATRVVATGFIPKGEYASETLDFTAPTGYSELCIRVNQYEECGFKTSTTSFASKYVSDLYAQEQAVEEVKTEDECIHGTPSVYSLFNLNVQAGVEDVLSPDLENIGITRLCASDNPGIGTDTERWADVGYCGDKNIRCWIDKDSVEDVIDILTLENDTLESLSERSLEKLFDKKDYIYDDNEFNELVKAIEEESNTDAKLGLIIKALDRAFFNRHKAQLYLMRGGVYAGKALEVYHGFINEFIREIISKVGNIGTGSDDADASADTSGDAISDKDLMDDGSRLGENIASLALEEYGNWDNGRLKENDRDGQNLLKEYYSFTSLEVPDSIGSEEPWSAVFISYVMREAGILFPMSKSHSEYFVELRDKPPKYECQTYDIFKIDVKNIRKGDIICKNRGDSIKNYNTLESGDSGHCDIVVSVGDQGLEVVGGNVDDSVSTTSISFNSLRRTPIKVDSYYGLIRCGVEIVVPEPVIPTFECEDYSSDDIDKKLSSEDLSKVAEVGCKNWGAQLNKNCVWESGQCIEKSSSTSDTESTTPVTKSLGEVSGDDSSVDNLDSLNLAQQLGSIQNVLFAYGFPKAILPSAQFIKAVSKNGDEYTIDLNQQVCAEVAGLGTLIAGKNTKKVCFKLESNLISPCGNRNLIEGLIGKNVFSVGISKISSEEEIIKISLERGMARNIDKSILERLNYKACS